MPSIAELSDDEFLNMGVPAVLEQQAAEQETAVTEETPVETEVTPPEVETTQEDTTTPPDPENVTVPATDKIEGQVETPVVTTPPVKEEGAGNNENPDVTKGSPPADTVVEGANTAETVPDYKAEYEKIMAPFTANGKQIELKSPAEVKQLLQMGANYTRKMQELAPHRRVLAMLQNNKLTDESELSFLIDLKRGDKAAIQKLIKDSGIDPRDIDVDSESTYQGGNHYVSDKQVNFQSTVDDLKTTEHGQAIIAATLKWDQASIDAVGDDPSILRTLHDQRATGVFDIVSAEVNRRKVLGAIPAETPFLQAYLVVGNDLAEQERRTKAAAAPVQVAKPDPVPVAKTVAQPKAVVANEDKVKAAAASRSTTAKTANPPVNFANLSDEDFMKNFANLQGRV